MSEAELQKSNTWREILSQSEIWRKQLSVLQGSSQVESILAASRDKQERLFVGCGTSLYLAEAAANSWTLLTGQRASALPASEILLFPKLVQANSSDTQAVVISRSGRTSEAVRAAATLVRDLRIPTVGITCDVNTPLQSVCDSTMVVSLAAEQSTVMTCSFTTMLITLQFLAARQAQNAQFIQGLGRMADFCESQICSWAARVEEFVATHTFADYVFLAQGPFYGIAREAALKVMEMSCSYSQFFHSLEFRHGPKAIVSPASCLTFFLSDTAAAAEFEVLTEMRQLGAITIAISNKPVAGLDRVATLAIELGASIPELAFLAPYVVPVQLLGFFTGLQKGLDPDNPKNLTRVVMLD